MIIGFTWNAHISPINFGWYYSHAIKKENVSRLIFICKTCRTNDTDLKEMKNGISDIKRGLSKNVS